MKEVIKIPQLRFPEFKVVQPWTKFGEVVSSNIYGPRFNANDYSESGNVRTIRGTDVDKNGEFKYEQVPVAMLDQKTIDNHKLEDGDLVMITTADCGLTGVFRKQNMDYISSAYGVRIRLNTKANPEYFKYFFQTRHAKREIISYERKATVSNLPGSDILKIKISLPQIDEQTKIANFLTTVDKRINLLTQKKEKLEQYKKGIMQQIFSQQLRFKDENGKDYPDWEETQFGSLYRFISTNSLSREKLNYESGLVKNIHYGDIHTKFKSHLIIDNELVPYINPDVDLEKINSDNFLMEGDLVIADASEDYFDIGKSIEICQLNGQLVLAGLHTLQARRKSNCPTIGYGGHMMKSNEVRTQIQRIAQGTKVLSIAANRLSDISIKIPCKAEQQKIASFLSNLDQKISLVNLQIELSRKWKQGLLQKMFV